MEDRVEFEGKSFTISTGSNEENQVVVKIENEGNDEKELLYHKIETFDYKPKKEELMKLHSKALSLLFKILQKDENPNSKDFEEMDKDKEIVSDDKKTSNISKISDEKNGKIPEILAELIDEKQIACFLLKDNELYQYVNNESFKITEEFMMKISAMIDFLKDNSDIEKLIGNWKMMVQSEKNFNHFASMIDSDDVLIIINDASMPMGTMLKRNETIREKFIEKIY